jgi:YidC/Oxa1 family membrane protein insertase
MDKRLGLALAISMGILILWWKIFPPPQPTPQSQQQPPAATQPASPAPTPTAPATAGTTPGTTTDAKPAPANAADQWEKLAGQEVEFVLSSWGGTLRQAHIQDDKKKFRDEQVVRTYTPETAPLLTTFNSKDFSLAGTAPYTVTRVDGGLVFTADASGVVVTKRYRRGPGEYQLLLDVEVSNNRDKPVEESLVLHLFGRQDPSKKGGSFLSYASSNLAEMVCRVGTEAKRDNLDTLHKEEKAFNGAISWIAADEKFFTVAAVPHPNASGGAQKCLQRAVDGLTGEVLIPFSGRTIAPGQKTAYSFTVFAGPKYKDALEAIQPGGGDPKVVEVVGSTYTFIKFLSIPLLGLLKFFQGFTHNWGIAIILLTLFVRLLTFYPQQRTMMSAKKMQKLAPKLAAIRKKYENDRQRQGVETMNLYKAHGVSPLGGCLPALIQMPIWMALFSTLNYAVELHRSSFLYIHDLSAPDPFYAAPLLMGVVMFFQMRMSPAGTDPQQQKMMSIMMPIMFTVFSLFLPAGLAIYTLTSYLIGILQQLLVNWLDKRREGGGTPAKAKP